MSPSDGVALKEVAEHLHSLSIHVLRSVRSADAETGLSGPRLSALSVVVYRGPVGMTELAAAEAVRPPTMTRLVQALEADGLVRRRRSRTDGRSVRVAATAKGRQVLERARRRRVEALAVRLDALAPTARADVARAVGALETVFGGPSAVRRPRRRSG